MLAMTATYMIIELVVGNITNSIIVIIIIIITITIIIIIIISYLFASFVRDLLRFLTSTCSSEPTKGTLVGPGGNFLGLPKM